jgi:hypothetical protein
MHAGVASAIDLGDPTSPFGNVHFQNKQTIARRIVSAAMAVAFERSGGSGGALEYPPPQFLSQVPAAASGGGSSCSMTVSFFKPAMVGGSKARNKSRNFSLALGATPDPGLPTNGSSAICPAAAVALGNCSGFELLCVAVTGGKATGTPLWLAAAPKLSVDGKTITLTATDARAKSLVARGSRYAWAAWPLATLFAADGGDQQQQRSKDDEVITRLGLPVLPWKQSLTCTNGKVQGAPC